MLDLLLNYHKRKLERLIDNCADYNKILRQSIILDKYISKKMRAIN